MTGADILLKSLIKEKVDLIFGYPGGKTIALHDKLKDYPQIKHILPRHEQGAAMMADAYYRVTGRPGVCLTTSGPGATNLITGVANAYMDSVGMVAITCQVDRDMVGTDAFQEVDITGITQPIVKHNYFVENVKELPQTIKHAFHLASTGRPRPVHIDIPGDIFKQNLKEFNYPQNINLPGYQLPKEPKQTSVDQAVDLIKKSARPVIIAGHGVLIARAWTELKQLAETSQIPVISTLLGIGSLPQSHPLCIGMLGMHGMAWANYAVHNADLIIGIGLRFDDRITGKIDEFAQDANVIHIDIDPAEIGKNTLVDVALPGDCKQILKRLNQNLPAKKHERWLAKVATWSRDHRQSLVKKATRAQKTKHLMAQDIIKEIDKQTKSQAVIASDVGQNQMWAAQFYNFQNPNQLLSSGGLGSMGYGLPAAIGAQFADPRAQVWAIVGDGGIQMNIQELGTIMEHQLPIKIVLLNNGYLGMVRQWQEMFFKKNYCATKLVNPNFIALAQAYNIKAERAADWPKAQKIIKQAALDKKQSFFMEFIIGEEDCVFPMVPPGNNLKDTIIKRNQ
ncbi:MAG: biosynthetic-type acetolactate synthase large subunit [Candidatus Moranbacteria bacterium]|nr:biosynthetic-type acetolactate synthase large subunit [Candidatus Moranbacteria bacterium]